ncbi:MAG TPA: hypothetical protein VL225_08685 [Vicinamibacterales bacterium]|jgi:hypothetical protein|nr:hypothetical protein [Vicinamibacterales bacterium]
MALPANGRDRLWLAVLAAAFAFGLAASWHRWGGPLIDTGREMNQPLRLAAGEALYSDVRHIYGPISPWFHATLFRLLGPSLNVLYADGIASAIVILALVYRLARRLMDPLASGIATLSVMWLCVFKPAGNYILPYSYSALHGTALSLGALAILAAALDSRGTSAIPYVVAGFVAALALLAKTELGLAALAAGMTAAALAGRSPARRIALGAAFLVPVVGLTTAVYAAIGARIGWSALSSDNWLLAYNLPPELAYYNRRISGLDRPLQSAGRVLIAAIKLGILVAVVSAGSRLAAGGTDRRRAWTVMSAAAALAITLSLTTGLDWDKGPYLAMPLLLAAVLLMPRARTPIVVTYAVFALVSLARMVLHVRSGGAYGSFLLPMSVVMFTYLWVGPFADHLSDPRARDIFRRIALGLMLIVAVVTGGVLAYRYRASNTVTVETARGTMIVPPDVGLAWNEALAFIEARTRPGDAVAVMPEGTSLDFLSARRNPLREEIVTPGYLNSAGEARAIRQLQEAHTPLILITDRLTEEFGPAVFGRDYCRQLMAWIDAHYTPCATFGPRKDPALQIGDKPFFIHAYCINP